MDGRLGRLGLSAVSVGTAMKGCGPWTRGGDATGSTLHATVWAEATSPARTRGIFHVEGSGGARVLAFLNSANYPAVWVAQGTEPGVDHRARPDPDRHLDPSRGYVDAGHVGRSACHGCCSVGRRGVCGHGDADPFHGWFGSRKVIVGSDGTRKYPWEGRIAAVAGHSTVLTPTLIARIAAARDGAAGDDAGHRASRLVWSCGAPWDTYDAGLSTMSAQPVDGRRWPTRCKPAPTRNARSGGSTVRDGRRCAPVVAVGSQPAATVPATSLDAGLRWEADDDGRITVARVKGPDGDETIRRHRDWSTLGV